MIAPTHTENHCAKSFSWKAALVGGFVAFGLLFLFNLLTVGGGLSAYTKTEEGLEAVVFITYLWTIVGSFLMFFIVGVITSMVLAHKNGACYDSCHSMLHGFVAWVVYLLLSIVVLSHVSDKTLVPQYFGGVSMASVVNEPGSAKGAVAAKAEERVGKLSHDVATNVDKKEVKIPVSEQKVAHQLGLAALAAFFVFFVEVIAVMFGAYCGRDFCCKKAACVKKEIEVKKV